jgi:hypothetical protein
MRDEESISTIDKYGTKICTNKNGKLHCLDGPAIEYSNGDKEWYQNGKKHRVDGPAIECVNGNKEWWQNGKLHRIGGPAIQWSNGKKFWYLGGIVYVNREDFFNELTDEEKEVALYSRDFHNA